MGAIKWQDASQTMKERTGLYLIKCGWGLTKAKLLYEYQGVYYWKDVKTGFEFISHDLDDTTKL